MANHYNREFYFAEMRRRQKRKRTIIGVIIVCCVLVVGVFAASNLSKKPSIEDSPQESLTPTETTVTDNKSTNTQESDDVVITLFGDENTLVLKGEEYIESGAHAVDSVNKVNISNIKTSGSVDTSKTGNYEIKYTATSDSGKVKTATRKVSVVDSFEGGNATAVPVLMYHYVYDSTNKPDDLDNNWIEASLLRQEVQWTKEQNFYYPSYEELVAFVNGKKSLPYKCVIFTFDDGKPEFFQSGVPIFNELQVPATSFVIGSDGEARDKVFNNPSKYVQYQSHSYAMHQAGSNVGRGGRIHACSFDEILQDQNTAVEMLGNKQAYAYPFGDNNETAQKALAKAGVECAFTIENRSIKQGDNVMALPRVRINGSYDLATFQALIG